MVASAAALLGWSIERFGLRPLQSSARIAPLLATIGISFVLDQVVQLTFSPDPRALPSQVPDWRFQVGGGTIGALDLLIAGVGLTSALLLFVFLRYSQARLGGARRPRRTATPRMQMGVDVNRVNQAVFAHRRRRSAASPACWSACTTTTSTPAMSFQATLKGVVAQVVGGIGNVPGAIVGSLLLGLVESYGVAVFGTSYRNLFAFVLLIAGAGAAAERPVRQRAAGAAGAADRHLHRAEPAGAHPALGAAGRASWRSRCCRCCPVVALRAADADQRLALGMLALSLTLVAGTVGQVSLGHAGAARDRRLCLGAAGARSRRAGRRSRSSAGGRDHARRSARC